MLAVIGGSGLSQLTNLDISHREVVRTPYGEPSGAVTFGQIGCRREACREQQGDEEEEEGECFCFYREQPPVVISMDKPR